jgi:hypothetical protein
LAAFSVTGGVVAFSELGVSGVAAIPSVGVGSKRACWGVPVAEGVPVAVPLPERGEKSGVAGGVPGVIPATGTDGLSDGRRTRKTTKPKRAKPRNME